MGKERKSAKRVTKSKAKEKKNLQIGPRLRLEPKLTPKSTKKKTNKDKQEAENSLHANEVTLKSITKIRDMREAESSSKFPKTNESGENSFLATPVPLDNFLEEMINTQQKSEASNVMNNNLVDEENNHSAPAEQNLASKDKNEIHSSEEEEFENVTKYKRRKPLTPKSIFWNDRELMDLAIGLQNEGFSDLQKIAEYVKTKNENEIFMYLKKRSLEAHKAEHPNQPPGRPNTWSTTSPENIATWPNIRKWRKLAFNQMLSLIRSKDYSKTVILALCKKFYEEEREPSDPQVINVKMIYKYILDCVSGELPAQLPPKESALVLDLLREMHLMPLACDFNEELEFLNGFKEATKFRPIEVKDEFKKRFKKTEDDEAVGSNTVSVAENVFMDLSRHKKIVQSFNPLVTPVWMLQKEQEMLTKYFEESNVYVG